MAERSKESDFLQGASFLTNVEDYALRVQQEADDYAKKIKAEADELKNSIESEFANALSGKRQAEDDAARIVSDAKAEAEKILENAAQTGRDLGYKEAHEKYQQEVAANLQVVQNLAKQITELKDDLLQNYEQEILKICLMMARAVIKSELQTNPKMVLQSLKAVIKKTQELGKVRIFLHPVDLAFAQKHAKEIEALLDPDQFFHFVADETVQAGSAKIETDFAQIDLDIAKQVKKLDDFFNDTAQARKQAYVPQNPVEQG